MASCAGRAKTCRRFGTSEMPEKKKKTVTLTLLINVRFLQSFFAPEYTKKTQLKTI